MSETMTGVIIKLLWYYYHFEPLKKAGLFYTLRTLGPNPRADELCNSL